MSERVQPERNGLVRHLEKIAVDSLDKLRVASDTGMSLTPQLVVQLTHDVCLAVETAFILGTGEVRSAAERIGEDIEAAIAAAEGGAK